MKIPVLITVSYINTRNHLNVDKAPHLSQIINYLSSVSASSASHTVTKVFIYPTSRSTYRPTTHRPNQKVKSTQAEQNKILNKLSSPPKLVMTTRTTLKRGTNNTKPSEHCSATAKIEINL